MLLDGRLCYLILLSLKKSPGIYETDIKMLNCIPRYESTKGQAEGSGLMNKPPTHPCITAPSPKFTNAPMNYYSGLVVKY